METTHATRSLVRIVLVVIATPTVPGADFTAVGSLTEWRTPSSALRWAT
ncbi:MAG: hypothetical protein IIC71_13375 [Acidobacteria bacterium]|nr:hypothetical protein [Acidobacteriota bacterium]